MPAIPKAILELRDREHYIIKENILGQEVCLHLNLEKLSTRNINDLFCPYAIESFASSVGHLLEPGEDNSIIYWLERQLLERLSESNSITQKANSNTDGSVLTTGIMIEIPDAGEDVEFQTAEIRGMASQYSRTGLLDIGTPINVQVTLALKSEGSKTDVLAELKYSYVSSENSNDEHSINRQVVYLHCKVEGQLISALDAVLSIDTSTTEWGAVA